jgi:uncharacterized protein
MTLPARKTCLALLKSKRVPDHIINHSLLVDCVARLLTRILNEQGENLDMRLVTAAALLHDITKMDGLRTGENHAKTGGDLLRHLGYSRVADVVECHVVVPDPRMHPKVTEEEIVNYADKRVMHDRIVNLEERFQDLKLRYGKNADSQARIAASLERARLIESKIFRHLDMQPEDLAVQVPVQPCVGR